MQNAGPDLDSDSADALDRLLWERASRRDGDALCEMFDHRAPSILGVLIKALSRAEAEDVLQEVFSDLWTETASSSPNGTKPFAWLLGRARIRAAERMNRARRQPRGSAGPGMDPRKSGGIRLADLQRA